MSDLSLGELWTSSWIEFDRQRSQFEDPAESYKLTLIIYGVKYTLFIKIV